MFVRHVASGRLLLSFGSAVILAGCAATPMGPTVQVMPGKGKSFDTFQADNTSCKSFAAEQVKGQAEAANQRAVGTALLATALGAGVGAAGGSLGGDVGGGTALGGAIGAAGGTALGANGSSADQAGIQAQYDNAFSQCMYAKGEQVPGYAPVSVAMAPAAMPTPDPVVRATQAELIRLGYLRDNADGFAGPKTRAAISAYEQANGMPPDGATSPRLLAKLQGTPTSGSATATASAPASNWVAPTTGAPPVIPASAPAWVAPTKSP